MRVVVTRPRCGAGVVEWPRRARIWNPPEPSHRATLGLWMTPSCSSPCSPILRCRRPSSARRRRPPLRIARDGQLAISSAITAASFVGPKRSFVPASRSSNSSRRRARHDERHTWYLDAANEFVATVSGSGRDRACWTFGRPPERVWFWIRRQALEAAVHRWDAELAAGSAGEFHSDLSMLGVTEVVEDLFPRQVALGRTPALSYGVELRAGDVDQRWVLSPPTDASGVVVEAPASVLMLLLWQRVSLDDPLIRFTGPTSVRDELSAARFTP